MFSSLFCLKGTDTRNRFLAIVGFCLALLLVLPALFGASPLLLILLLPLCFVLFAASQRANANLVFGGILSGLYLLAAVFMVFGIAAGAGVAAVAALVPVFLIARQAAPVINGAEQGYLAPGQRVVASASRRRREPVFGEAGDEPVLEELEELEELDSQQPESVHRREARQADPLADIKSVLSANPRLLPGAAAAVVLLLVLVAFVSLWPDSSDEQALPQEEEPQTAQPAEVRDEVKLPDGFSLGLVDGRLVMSWLGDKGDAGELWSLATAKGDKRCSVLKFNNGSEYRPLVVQMTAETVTEAWFSPLDARAVIQDVAMRGNAQLCGYKFSLKGTQSRLEAHRAFAPYL